ncbi:hypothetical protein IU500_07210 [Nocardia terpenica]|uniref:hypothetical protein n=1 Tax=Nocardia terpenica TaxID=455432 RepID=UPI001893295A|nr:hypothetical protein [Nocardia terpenica]MBF6060566.1 hypothetical protein [Nocardia terpenica]MBF6103826.1 hypothetical protein [Nocardia terpenica]MBF6111800.1 hypothetical protein [Nocardia terpenica]MBF6118047.1 hypothetical protein [Nocardia terpenica]MBF6155227.1 hypothetical protein [Nocardia terpenica]
MDGKSLAAQGITVGLPCGRIVIRDGMIEIGTVIRSIDGALELVPRIGLADIHVRMLCRAADLIRIGRVDDSRGSRLSGGRWATGVRVPYAPGSVSGDSRASRSAT